MRAYYLVFVISLIAQLALATLHYEGLAHFQGVCFLTFNYVLAFILRDWWSGFRFFFLERRLHRSSQSPSFLFLFGKVEKERKTERLVRKSLLKQLKFWRRAARYLLFSAWNGISIYLVFPKLEIPWSLGLSLSMLTSWIILVSFQSAHFVIVIAAGALLALLSFLKNQGQVPWIYLPYILLLFANLSAYRSFLKKEPQAENRKLLKPHWGDHFYGALNVVVLFVALTVILLQGLEWLKGRTQPLVETQIEKMEKKVKQFAQEKVRELAEQQLRQSEQSGNTQGSPQFGSETGRGPESPGYQASNQHEQSQQQKELQRALEKLAKMDQQKLQEMLGQLQQHKDWFKKAQSKYHQSGSREHQKQWRQAQQQMTKAQRQISDFKREAIASEDVKPLQELLTKNGSTPPLHDLRRAIDELKSSQQKSLRGETGRDMASQEGLTQNTGGLDVKPSLEPSQVQGRSVGSGSGAASGTGQGAAHESTLAGDPTQDSPGASTPAHRTQQDFGDTPQRPTDKRSQHKGWLDLENETKWEEKIEKFLIHFMGGVNYSSSQSFFILATQCYES